MAVNDDTRGITKTPLTEKQRLLELYDDYCELLALQQFYYEAMEGLALRYHYPMPLRQGHSLVTGWLKDQNRGFKKRFQLLVG